MGGRYRNCYEEDMLLDSEHAPGGVIVYYADGGEEIIHVNRYIIDLFECDSIDDFLEHVQGSFRGFVYGDDVGAAEDSIWGQVEKHDNLDHIYYRIKTKTGAIVNVEDFGRLVEQRDGRPVFYVFVIRAEQRGTIDWMTGLPSMARFHELAKMGAATIRKRGERPVAVALDLVGMKSYNTQYGREEGDNLLCVFADVLRDHFGSEACSRFGEDHFYAFAPYEGINERIEALFNAFKEANGGRVLPIRSGSYVCNDDDDIIAVGFDRAKIACDLDRKTWQSHNMWFDEAMRAEAHLRIHVLDRVDQAIEEGWIRPYYQGIVRSATGNVCCEEALARWIDPVYGELKPDQFIPVLEEAGLLQKVDMHMVDCVLADFAVKQQHGMSIVPVSVNISLRDLGELDIVEELTRKTKAHSVKSSLLRVEFTESAASKDPELFNGQVRALSAAGFDVWLDDFGSGFSSLNTLQEYAFDLIKLDMEFIHDVYSDKARDIVEGVVRVAKRLGVGVLAEGVETEQQALFLEAIGCDMLQGFYYTEPQSIDKLVDYAVSDTRPAYEEPSESEYWTAVSSVDLVNPVSNTSGRSVEGSLSELPAGVMEHRNGKWNLLRANESFRNFLIRGEVLPPSSSQLQANPVDCELDEEFVNATARSYVSGMWERIAGRLEFGTGYQFYTRTVASASGVDSYLLAAVPTMWGTTLGTYGDVPVAYAVFRVVFNEDEGEVVDAEFVYANSVYCEWGGYDHGSLTSRSYLDVNSDANGEWFPYAYRAVKNGETVNDTLFSSEINHWINFSVSPSPVEGCCVFAFTIADDEQRERAEIIEGRDTADLIVRIAGVFDKAHNYDAAMNAVLEMMSDIIHPKRLFIFERGQGIDWVTHEWCADNVDRQIDAEPFSSSGGFASWDKLAAGDSVIYVPDTKVIEKTDEMLYRKLKREGVTHMLAAPLYDGDVVIGNLVAENYEFEEGIDVKRLLETVASFISSRIVNHRLVNELQRAGTHDVLTGLLNRRGFDRTIADRMQAHPGEPYVLALMDIDDFKTVNDLYGHEVGDAALRALAHEVGRIAPGGAVLGRNGGDEFVMMLFGADAANADTVFKRISMADKGCEHDGKWYRLTMSIGYVGVPEQAVSLNDAYSKADAALYSVKLVGKSNYKRYTPEVETQYRSQLGFTPRDIAENVPGAIVVHRASDNGEILFANDELLDMFECRTLADFMELTGGTFAGIVHPDDAPRVYEELVRQVSLDDIGSKNFSNYRIVTKSGKVKNVADNGRLVEIDGVGKVFYVLIVDCDERDGLKGLGSDSNSHL